MVEASLVYNERNASPSAAKHAVPRSNANAIGCVEVDSGEESGDEVCVVAIDSQSDGATEYSDEYSDCFSVHSGSTDDVAAAALPLASVSVYTDSEDESSGDEAKVAPLALILERDGVLPTTAAVETPSGTPTASPAGQPAAPIIETTTSPPPVTTAGAHTETPTATNTETSTAEPSVMVTAAPVRPATETPTQASAEERPPTLPERAPPARPTLLARKPARSLGNRAAAGGMISASTPSSVTLDAMARASLIGTSELQKMTASYDRSPSRKPAQIDDESPGHSLRRCLQAAEGDTTSQVPLSNTITAMWQGTNADLSSRPSPTCNRSRTPSPTGVRPAEHALRTSLAWPLYRSRSRSASRSRSRSRSRSHSLSRSTWSRHCSPPTTSVRPLRKNAWSSSRKHCRGKSRSPPSAPLPWSPRSSCRVRRAGSARAPAFLTPLGRSTNMSARSQSKSRSQSRSRTPPVTRPTPKSTRLAQITATLSTPEMLSPRKTAQTPSQSWPPPPNVPQRSVIPRFLRRASTESVRSCSRSPSFSPLRKRPPALIVSSDPRQSVRSTSRSRSPPLVASRHSASLKAHNYSPRRQTNSTRSTSPTAARSCSSSSSRATDDDQLSIAHHNSMSNGHRHNLPSLVRTPFGGSSLRPYEHTRTMGPHPLALPAPPTMRILPPPIRPASSSMPSTMRPAPIPPVRGGFLPRNAPSASSVQSKIEQLKADAVKKGEQPEAGQGVSDGQCPLLSILQGSWSSSFRNDRVVVDLIWVYIRGQKSNHTLTRVKDMWRWSGWNLIEIQDGKLRWEKFGCIVVWTRVGPIPELQCNYYDITGDESSAPCSAKALRLLKRTFEISETVRTHPHAELYGLEFTQSQEGVFAACLLLRAPNEQISMIIYFATRSPIQGLGFGKIMLERVKEAPVRAPGCGDCKRWAAIVRRKTRSKTNDAAMWWQKANFVKDVTAELEDANPFEDCIALEYEEHQSKRVARRDEAEHE